MDICVVKTNTFHKVSVLKSDESNKNYMVKKIPGLPKWTGFQA